jgi:hypothetical protein
MFPLRSSIQGFRIDTNPLRNSFLHGDYDLLTNSVGLSTRAMALRSSHLFSLFLNFSLTATGFFAGSTTGLEVAST